MYVMDNPYKWEDYLHLVDFAYNNGYQASLRMIPFESLYGMKCDTLVSWDNSKDRVVLGPELLKDMEDQVVKIKQNLKVAQDKVGEHVLLKVNPKKRSLKLSSCTKMAPRFYGPFEIMDIIGPIAYMLALPASINVHNVFHVSLLKKYVDDPNHVIDFHLIQV